MAAGKRGAARPRPRPLTCAPPPGLRGGDSGSVELCAAPAERRAVNGVLPGPRWCHRGRLREGGMVGAAALVARLPMAARGGIVPVRL